MIEYMEWLKFNRGYSDYSIRNYLTGLNQLDNYLKIVYGWGVEECEKIKIRYINDFVREQILIREMNPRTVNNYLAGIKLYFRFCLIQGKDVENYSKIMYVKEHRKKIDALNEVECVKLFEYFKNVKAVSREEELIKVRNLVLVSMFMYTGLRLGELVNLKSEDIAEDMQIEGKGGKMRYISIHPDDLKIIEYYLFLRKDNSEWLFVSHQKGKESKKLSKVSIEHIISEGAKNAGITVPVFPHKLRHTFATNLLRCNAPLPHIQQLLGHENISTTQIYLTVLNSEIKKTQNSIHRFG